MNTRKSKPYDDRRYLARELKTKNYKQIALENNISVSTIQRKLHKSKLTKKRLKWSESEINLLKTGYGRDRTQLAKLFPNRNLCSIYHKANRLKLHRLVKPTKYRTNEEFFYKWSREMAYALGWLFSDGHVSKDKTYFSFHLNYKDAYILEKFRRILGSDHPIRFYDHSVELKVYSKIMCEPLIKLGCKPNKTHSLDFPQVPGEYLNHFVRGFFEGDGSICFNKPNTIKVSFVGTKQFISGLQKALNHKLGLKINKITKNRNIYDCRYYGDDARKFCFWLYSDAGDLYLKRKRERFINHIKRREHGRLYVKASDSSQN